MARLVAPFVVIALFLSSSRSSESPRARTQPEQIHLSYGDNELELVVTWSTFSLTPVPIVEYGIDKTNLRSNGTTTKFVDGGKKQKKQYIHRVKLTGLQPDTNYMYHCGSEVGWSDEFVFRTAPASKWFPKVAIVGDMGSANAVSLPALQEKTQDDSYDAVIHIGDFAYDMADKNGKVGDDFMNQIQPIATYVPYMVCPGNHEHHYNFSHYRERFSMPGNTESLYYSFNMGPVHFVSVNTEVYFYPEYFGKKHIAYQYEWLLRDLESANANRKERPWIVLYGHRPMYCSGLSDECLNDSPIRSGILIASEKQFGLEKLLNKYGVDIVFWGHQHNYERFFPIYDYKVKNGSDSTPYVDPKAPVHIISGASGSDEMLQPFMLNPIASSAFRNLNYGFTEVEFHNMTHVSLRQIATNANNTIVDELMVVKHYHGPYVDLSYSAL